MTWSSVCAHLTNLKLWSHRTSIVWGLIIAEVVCDLIPVQICHVRNLSKPTTFILHISPNTE